jgi:hypothetical protein
LKAIYCTCGRALTDKVKEAVAFSHQLEPTLYLDEVT